MLTGRLENKTLQAFAFEVLKKFGKESDQLREESSLEAAEQFRVPHQTFKRAARKAIELISYLPKSILKKRLTDTDLANADVRIKRQIRAFQRERSKALLFEDINTCAQNISRSSSPIRESLTTFTASDSHFLKKVTVHPERDVETVRVID